MSVLTQELDLLPSIIFALYICWKILHKTFIWRSNEMNFVLVRFLVIHSTVL